MYKGQAIPRRDPGSLKQLTKFVRRLYTYTKLALPEHSNHLDTFQYTVDTLGNDDLGVTHALMAEVYTQWVIPREENYVAQVIESKGAVRFSGFRPIFMPFDFESTIATTMTDDQYYWLFLLRNLIAKLANRYIRRCIASM